MFEILRNLTRHKFRTTLTILGIVIGIFAVTVMGSMTEYFNTLIDNGLKMAAKNITVTAKGGLHAMLTDGDRRAVERVSGVRVVFPVAEGRLDQASAGVQMGPPPSVLGFPAEYFDYETLQLKSGRWIQRGDTYAATIGAKIAQTKKLSIGDTLVWREHDLTVVGVLAETETAPDNYVYVPIEIARHIMQQPNLISALFVFPQDMRDADALVARIRASVDTVKVQTLEEQLADVRTTLATFYAILLSGAVISALVGGLAVANTMIMSVNERTREIGLKKAIGATDGEIVREYLSEALVIGALGGVIGLALGYGMAGLLNGALAQSLGGTSLFLVTPRLAAVAVAFAVVLGGLAGLYPAWNASRLNPVDALRSE